MNENNLKDNKQINLSFRIYNIIPTMRKLSGKIYPEFENAIKYLSDKELSEINNFLMEMKYKIDKLEEIQNKK